MNRHPFFVDFNKHFPQNRMWNTRIQFFVHLQYVNTYTHLLLNPTVK